VPAGNPIVSAEAIPCGLLISTPFSLSRFPTLSMSGTQKPFLKGTYIYMKLNCVAPSTIRT